MCDDFAGAGTVPQPTGGPLDGGAGTQQPNPPGPVFRCTAAVGVGFDGGLVRGAIDSGDSCEGRLEEETWRVRA